MARSFKGDTLKDVLNGKCPKGFPPDILKGARRKLAMVIAAAALEDLKSPPGNKLHPLTNDRAGQWAIWINGQFRVCFKWTEAGAADIEITDYH